MRLRLALIAFLTAWVCCSCDDYDDFTTDVSACLSLPLDTLAFDPVITTVSTPTKAFVVYNRGKKGLRISAVSLQGGEASPFRVNVDGEPMSYGVVNDLMVRAGDSLFVRVEVTLPEWEHDEMARLTDCLTFTLESGVKQSVVLTVDGRNGTFFYNKVITADTALTARRPYIIYGEMVVKEGVCLTLEPGVTMMFHPEASLRVEGSLQALGAPDSMVVLRGDRTDRMFANLYYDNTPMRWGGVYFTSRSHDNVLRCTDLHSATWGVVVDSTDVRLDSCVLHNIGGTGLRLNVATCNAYNSQLSNTLGDCMFVKGGAVTMQYCTLAQFYPWDANRGVALHLTNLDEGLPLPAMEVRFQQCLITGYAEDVVTGELDEEQSPVDYLFTGCFIKTVAEEGDEHYPDTWFQPQDDDITTRFVLFDTDNYLYNFHLQAEEPVTYGIR